MAKKNREHIRKLREEANAIRKQEQAKQRRNRVLLQLGIVGGAVILIAGLVFAFVKGADLLLPRGETNASGTISLETSAGETVEQPIQLHEGGYVSIGAAEAPVVLDYYYDYSCPHCVEYHRIMGAAYTELAASGQVRVNYRPIQFVAPYGKQAAAALLAATQHQPESFLTVSDGLFSVPGQTQTDWDKGDYAALLPQLGVTSPEAAQAVDDGAYLLVVNESTDAARDAGVKGTPSLAVNGQVQETLPSSPEELRTLVSGQGAVLPTPTASAPAASPGSGS